MISLIPLLALVLGLLLWHFAKPAWVQEVGRMLVFIGLLGLVLDAGKVKLP